MGFNPYAPPETTTGTGGDDDLLNISDPILPYKSLEKVAQEIENYPSSFNGIHFVGAHGGAGTTTMAKNTPASLDFGQKWPDKGKVILCAKGDQGGLNSLEKVLKLWAAGGAGDVQLWGVVVFKPIPKWKRKLFIDQIRIIESIAPNFWLIDFSYDWFNQPDSLKQPSSFVRLRKSLEKQQRTKENE